MQIAGVLGVSEKTVDRDQAAVRGGPSNVGTERECARDEDERDASNVGTGPEVFTHQLPGTTYASRRTLSAALTRSPETG